MGLTVITAYLRPPENVVAFWSQKVARYGII